MKKSDIVALIKAYANNNRTDFINKSMDIANDFKESGDVELSQYIMSLFSEGLNMSPQGEEQVSSFFTEISDCNQPLYLPEGITSDLLGIINSIKGNKGLNKFLFIGKPGTGKTEAVKQLAKALGRTILCVNFSTIVDSALGQTNKNLISLFKEINNLYNPSNYIVLFDEIDALVLDRINKNDLREMGRATSTFLKCLDTLDNKVLLIGTTNLYEYLDKALVRRFDAVISFDCYSLKDKIDIANNLISYYKKGNNISKDERLLSKIIKLTDNDSLTPGILKNTIRQAIAFSSVTDPNNYLMRIFDKLKAKPYTFEELSSYGFTVREIEILTGVSKSTVSRKLSEGTNE